MGEPRHDESATVFVLIFLQPSRQKITSEGAEGGGGSASLLVAKFPSFNSDDCAVLKYSGKKTVRLCS